MIAIKSLMDRFVWHTGATTILYVTGLHLCWAVLVAAWPTATFTTPLHALYGIFGYGLTLPSMFLIGAIFATIGAYNPGTLAGVLCMLPQQGLLMVAASGAVEAVLMGSYPDGTVRPWLFILADQVSLILLAPAYTLAILSYHQVFRKPWKF